jgi:hypothetical protein
VSCAGGQDHGLHAGAEHVRREPKGPSATATRKRTYGTLVSYTGSQAATTTFTVLRPLRGRKRGKTCAKPSKANRLEVAGRNTAGVGPSMTKTFKVNKK